MRSVTVRMRALALIAAAGIVFASVKAAHADEGDWPNYGRDGSEQHYSPLTEVTTQNAGRLGLAWHFLLESGYTLSTPVAAEGKLFVTTGHSHIRAFDAVTGKLL